tara:strand:- start:606331 stop:606468 length:138 start_codon:yes stop_codon:yes gene_type:complete
MEKRLKAEEKRARRLHRKENPPVNAASEEETESEATEIDAEDPSI